MNWVLLPASPEQIAEGYTANYHAQESDDADWFLSYNPSYEEGYTGGEKCDGETALCQRSFKKNLPLFFTLQGDHRNQIDLAYALGGRKEVENYFITFERDHPDKAFRTFV